MPGPLVIPSAGTVTGISLERYRAAIGGEIGHWRRLTVSSTPSTSVTPDAARQLICAALRSDGVPPSRFDGHWLYVPSTGETRRVWEGSYDGADASLLLDTPLSSPLVSGTTVELTNTLPGSWYADLKGLNQIVNDALNRLFVWARITLTGDGTRLADLNAYGDWLTDVNMISHIEDRWSDVETDPTEVSPFGFRIQQDGADRTLVTDLAYAEDGTYTLIAIRRGDAWINSGGTWAASTVGLQAEDDEAAAPLRWVRIWGAVLALRYLIEVTDEDETLSEQTRARRIARYERRITTYQPVMAQIIEHELPRPRPQTGRPLTHGTTGRYGSDEVADVAGARARWF